MRVCQSDTCDTILAHDNRGDLCGPCSLGRWSTPYWDGLDRLDGTELANWLAPFVPAGSSHDSGWLSALTRSIHRWRAPNSIVFFEDVERYLILLDIRPEEIPAECWTTRKRRRHKWPPQVKGALLVDYANGVPPAQLRKKYGVSLETIHSWRKREGLPLQDASKSVDRKAAA